MDSGFPNYYQLGKPFGRRLDFQGMSKKVRSFSHAAFATWQDCLGDKQPTRGDLLSFDMEQLLGEGRALLMVKKSG